MIPASSISAWAALELAGNHLWQSTLFAAFAGLLTLMLRNNRAQVRYWLWLAVSAKFLVPFAALVSIGRQFGWRSSAPIPQPELTFIVDAMSQPFSQPELRAAAVASTASATSGVTAAIPILLLAIWLCGCAALLVTWWIRWRRVAVIVRQGSPVHDGREVDMLRRIEQACGLKRSIALISCDTTLEPGVFGIVKPALLWPRGIGERLDDEQLEAILAHELSHVRRRDNLVAAVHMVVEALFWFHPLVWWVGARLVDERERACDEDVIRLGNEPQVYAESILKTCEFCLESPLACVAGVTGADLKKRIEQIMRHDRGTALSVWRKLLLAAVGVVALAGPVAVGVLNAPRLRAQSSASVEPGGPAFEVASVKPNQAGPGRTRLGFAPGGRFTATSVTLKMLIAAAYGSPEPMSNFQILGGPNWIASDRFDIEARANGDPPGDADGVPRQMLLMLRSLLADRFKLTVHSETKELPIYALVLARSDRRNGPQLRTAAVDCAALRAARSGAPPNPPSPGERPPCLIGGGPGNIVGGGTTMAQLAFVLTPRVNRVVVDKTNLAGSFDLDLTWTPDQIPPAPVGGPLPGSPPLPPIDPNGPSIFTAIQEQLGLKLESTTGPVDVLVIDRAEKPTED